jgi:hypothetical protein
MGRLALGVHVCVVLMVPSDLWCRTFAVTSEKPPLVLVHRISIAVAEACGRETERVALPSRTQVKTNWVLTYFPEYPLDQAALGDLLALENPMVLESITDTR